MERNPQSNHWLVAWILPVILLAAGCSGPEPGKPNVVFILVDDMGYSDLGSYGAEVIQTPSLDDLAAGGLRFTDFYNTGRCWPTRTSLLSGYYPHQVLSDRIAGIDYGEGEFRPVTERWLPELLKEHGYRCYHSGKWHLFRRFPDRVEMTFDGVGFDRSYRTQDGRHLRPRVLLENGEEIPLPGPEETYEASVAITDHAVKYLEEHARDYGEKPFFAYLAFIAPHFPLQALQRDIAEYRDRFGMGWNRLRELRAENMEELGFEVHDVAGFEPDRFAPWNLSREELIDQIDSAEVARAIPWNQLTEAQQEFQAIKMAVHAAMVTRMDREIGRFVDTLKELGYYENTIIFFCSDNGASTEIMNRADKHTRGALPGSADSYICLGPGWSTASNTPFRLHKTWVHEGGIATPLIVHWPAGIPQKGEFRHMPAHITDIAPTLLELAGGDPQELDGRYRAPGVSLVPVLKADREIDHPPIFFHHQGKSALRQGGWKITTIEEGGDWELYDLSVDRGETGDRSASDTARLDEMAALWESMRKEIEKQIRE